jgi:hypothetical protein
MPAMAERAFIFHGGDEPGADQVDKIISEFERDTGIDLRGAPITYYGARAGEPDETVGQFLVFGLEGEGEVSARVQEQTIVRTITVNGTRWIIAVVLAEEPYPPSAPHAAASPPDPPKGRHRRTY